MSAQTWLLMVREDGVGVACGPVERGGRGLWNEDGVGAWPAVLSERGLTSVTRLVAGWKRT